MNILKYFLNTLFFLVLCQSVFAYDIELLKKALSNSTSKCSFDDNNLSFTVGILNEEKLKLRKRTFECLKSLYVKKAFKTFKEYRHIDSFLKFLDYCYVTGDQNNKNIKVTKALLELWHTQHYVAGFINMKSSAEEAFDWGLVNLKSLDVVHAGLVSVAQNHFKTDVISDQLFNISLTEKQDFNRYKEVYENIVLINDNYADKIIKDTRLDARIYFSPIEKNYKDYLVINVLFPYMRYNPFR